MLGSSFEKELARRYDETEDFASENTEKKIPPTPLYQGGVKPLSSLDLLPPLDKESMKNWHSPLLELAKSYPEPTIEQITKEDFDTWRLALADSGLSVKTVNAHIITIRSWLKYLKKEQINCLDPTTLDLMKVADREVTFLTSEEIKRFFAAIVRKTIQGKRDYAIAECIYSTGLRISELTALNRSDVNFETLEFAVRGKGGKLRVVYLTETARDAIQEYLSARNDEFIALFIRHNWSEIPLQPGRSGMRIGSGIPLQPGRGGTSKASDGVVLPWNGDEYIIKKGISYKDIPYNPALRIRASELRKSGNLPEVVFWNTVKNKAWHNLDFDRQKIIGNYIVDFYNKYLGLVVEIDGNSHDEKVEYDSERDAYFRGIGLRVVRFPVIEIMRNIEGCMDTLMRFIIEHCEVERLPRPAGTPSDGRGIGTSRSLDKLGTGPSGTPSDGRGMELPRPSILRGRTHAEDTSNIPSTDREYRLTRFFITNMVKEYGLRAGILKNMHAHTLRHSFATTLLTNGADIRIIQELLGHASITTTQVYTHVTNPKLKEAHQKFHR